MKKRILPLVALCAVALLPSCLVFKCYNGRAEYKDNQREIVIASDTLIGVGNKALNVVEVQPLNPRK